jgi:hypothetical protein
MAFPEAAQRETMLRTRIENSDVCPTCGMTEQ